MSSLTRSFALFSGASFVGSLTQVAKGKLTAIFLGAEGVGILNQLTSMWTLASVISSLGMYSGMVRHLSGYWSDENRDGFRAHISSQILFLFLTSLLVTVAGCVFSAEISNFLFHDEGARQDLVCLILLAVPIFVVSQIYRATLNATRSVSAVVRARITADILSVAALAGLIVFFGLTGAVLGYVALHLLYLGLVIFHTRRAVGAEFVVPRMSQASRHEVARNFSFGVHGLIVTSIDALAAVLVARWIIADFGAEMNGIFAMALKVTSVYLGGLAGVTGGYYMPTLVAARTKAEMHQHISTTLSQYMFLLPPIIVGLMATGDVLMVVLFSEEFIPAAALLLIMLPGDVFKIVTETLRIPLVARKHLIVSGAARLFWAALYLALVMYLMPDYGLTGVAIAYLASHGVTALLVIGMIGVVLGYRIPFATAFAVLKGVVLVFASGALLWIYDDRWQEYLMCAGLLAVWFAISLADPAFRTLLTTILAKVRRVAAG